MTSEAPETIWAFYAPELAEDNCGATICAHENIQHGGQSYTRSDLADKRLSEAQAEIERMRGALTLAEDDQIDLLYACLKYAKETNDFRKKELRIMRADAVADRLNKTRKALGE